MVPAVNPPTTSCHVAVIGAGAAGLVAARELRRSGHSVVVFERGNQIGGVWAYTPNVEPDPLSIDPTRPVIHSSLYSSLRTIIPRECMGFTDFPFSTRLENGSRDPRRHPGHSEVLAYLKDFAREFKIEEMIRFDTEVVRAEPAAKNPKKWRVESRNSGDVSDEIYDAVVVCNGHYTEPRHALIPGIDSWPGKQIHSHNYRVPDQFRDQVVVVIGSSVSGVDISRDIANVTKEVHISSRSTTPETYEKLPGYDNLWFHSTIETVREDGSVVFRNGKTVYADTIMHCTGYKYYFPFLDTKGEVTPFPMFELQSKWVAAVLAGRVKLPSQEEMMEDTEMFYAKLEASSIPKRYTHLMAELDSQFVYDNWLADQLDYPRIEKWREQMFYNVFKRIQAQSSTYKDDWDDDHLIAEANEDFAKFTSNYPSSLIES
ncbi:FAD/NAD(P)-binding domain superfamily [Arabidopsis suecica]|uniref:Flavin-containing monooxygenase n=1 Tax=Arabidopsis suecica TaxID=45249 RepID=A0A8T2BWP8_ARASU|nr:FAD/NAD(P)-binding domain superfamily [Arabidopsis suecica]